ncbi:MAG TPA: hypothetical protein VI318_10380 [Baekduia sp.]
MKRFATTRRTRRLVATSMVAVLAAAAFAWGRRDDERPAEPARLVLRDAAQRQRTWCHERPRFTVYALGERFHGELATRFGSRCETHADQTEVFYGPCRDAGESGCGNDISVRSSPACQRRSELYTIFNNGPGDVTTLRGVPAAVFDDRVELLTRDTAINVWADRKLALKAVRALRPAGRPAGQRSATRAPLPRPAGGVVAGRLSALACST